MCMHTTQSIQQQPALRAKNATTYGCRHAIRLPQVMLNTQLWHRLYYSNGSASHLVLRFADFSIATSFSCCRTHDILLLKGVMGSLCGATSAAMRASRIMKLVAHVSSSIKSTVAPSSNASCRTHKDSFACTPSLACRGRVRRCLLALHARCVIFPQRHTRRTTCGTHAVLHEASGTAVFNTHNDTQDAQHAAPMQYCMKPVVQRFKTQAALASKSFVLSRFCRRMPGILGA
jgi:hypothetical protein